MKTASAFSVAEDTAAAAHEAARTLLAKMGRDPDLLVVYATEPYATPTLIESMRAAFPGVPIVGGTSCGGVMTEAGFHAGPAGAVGLFGLVDPGGDYGVGAAAIGDDPRAAGAAAVERALHAAGRDFEAPVLVWCCQPPGVEEAVLEGVQSIVGTATPIIGGSAADETLGGGWRQFTADGVLNQHVAVAVLFPSVRHGAAFQSGYAPTDFVGAVTRAEDRRILEIDHRPAVEVYSEWTEGRIGADEAGLILARSAAAPLGRVAADVKGVPLFLLSHPSLIGTQGDLSLFTDIAEGDRVYLMQGSPDSLVKRAGVVVADACATGGWSGEESFGGLVIYCGGCMLHVRDRMDEVVESIRTAMPGAPFLGAFTFGEQGAIVDNCNRHGNLMVSALAFG